MHPLLLAFCILLGLVALFFLWLTINWLLVDKKKKYTDESRYYRFVINISTVIASAVMRIHVHTEGMEKIPREGSVLFVSNHRGNFDPILSWYQLRAWKPVFISKQENFNLPWFGRYIHRLRFLAIDRSSVAASRHVFMEASHMLQEGTNIMVYPEGTRSRGENMLPFHTAAFVMAVRSKVPVVVMTIRGTEQVNHNFPWHRTDVYLRVLETIPVSWSEAHTLQELSERAETMMREDLGLTAE